jgi:hypothetical protein
MRTAPKWISLMLMAGVVTIGVGIDNTGWSGAAVAPEEVPGSPIGGPDR